MKEEPSVYPLSGAGAFYGNGDLEQATYLPESFRVLQESALVKIDSKQPACFIKEQGIYSNCMFSRQVIINNLVGNR